METYYEKNRELLDRLQNNVRTEEIHGISMEVKDIPDPVFGTVLDPRVHAYLKKKEEQGNPWAECLEIPVELIREDPGYPNKDITTVEIKKENLMIDTRNGSVPAFLYKPETKDPGLQTIIPESIRAGRREKKPVMVFFHGGAFIAGSTKVVENFLKLVVELADMAVIGVDYHLAPEHKFPAAVYDCYDALQWTVDHGEELGIDTSRVAVGGDSAGGTLAIDCCLLEREAVKNGALKQNRICYEALLYPGVLVDNFKMEDYRFRLSDFDIPEEDTLAMGAALSLKAMTAEMPILYMGEEGHVRDPLAAPLCQEKLSGLPKSLVVLCEYDYLRLSAEAFCRKLVRDQVETRTVLYRGMDHAFVDKTGDFPQAFDAAVEIAKDMRRICEN